MLLTETEDTETLSDTLSFIYAGWGYDTNDDNVMIADVCALLLLRCVVASPVAMRLHPQPRYLIIGDGSARLAARPPADAE